MPAGRRRRPESPDYPGGADRPGWDQSGRDDSPDWDDRSGPGADPGWDDRSGPGPDPGWDDRAALDDHPGADYRSGVQARSRTESRRLGGRSRSSSSSSGSGSRSSIDAFNDDTDQDLPPWAGLAIYPA